MELIQIIVMEANFEEAARRLIASAKNELYGAHFPRFVQSQSLVNLLEAQQKKLRYIVTPEESGVLSNCIELHPFPRAYENVSFILTDNVGLLTSFRDDSGMWRTVLSFGDTHIWKEIFIGWLEMDLETLPLR